MAEENFGRPTDPAPPHERTAPKTVDAPDWNAVAATDSFRRLIKAKRRFIIPAMIIFIVYYFALPVLVGYAPAFMQTRVFGAVNIAYLFALSQFFVAWIIAALYVRAAAKFDKMASDISDNIDPPTHRFGAAGSLQRK